MHAGKPKTAPLPFALGGKGLASAAGAANARNKQDHSIRAIILARVAMQYSQLHEPPGTASSLLDSRPDWGRYTEVSDHGNFDLHYGCILGVRSVDRASRGGQGFSHLS